MLSVGRQGAGGPHLWWRTAGPPVWPRRAALGPAEAERGTLSPAPVAPAMHVRLSRGRPGGRPSRDPKAAPRRPAHAKDDVCVYIRGSLLLEEARHPEAGPAPLAGAEGASSRAPSTAVRTGSAGPWRGESSRMEPERTAPSRRVHRRVRCPAADAAAGTACAWVQGGGWQAAALPARRRRRDASHACQPGRELGTVRSLSETPATPISTAAKAAPAGTG